MDEAPKFLGPEISFSKRPWNPYLSLLGNQDSPFTLDSTCHTVSQGHFSFQDPMAAQEPEAVVTLSPLLQILPWSPHRSLILPLLLGCCIFPQICSTLSSGFPQDLPLVPPGVKLHWTSVYVYGMLQIFGLVLMGSSQLHVLISFSLGQRHVIAQVCKQMRFSFLITWYTGIMNWLYPRIVFAKIPSFQ